MLRLPSSCVARFPTKMHTDTIVLLFCLLMVTLGIGHNIVSSGVVPKIIYFLSEVFDYLYWEANYFCWNIRYEYTHNGIPTYLRILGFLTICAFTPRMLCEFLRILGINAVISETNVHELAEKGESQITKKAATPILAPDIPLPPTRAHSRPTPPAYPPPSQFPFKNFRGTGESYAHPDRSDPMQFPVYRLPKTWGKLCCADSKGMVASMDIPGADGSMDHKEDSTEATTSKPEEPQHIAESATKDIKKSVAFTPTHKAVELPLQSSPAPKPISTPSAYTPTPSNEPRTIATSVYIPAPSSPEPLRTVYNCVEIATAARMAIEHHAKRASALQYAMRTFLLAADAKTECMDSAGEIWSFISSAENDLKLFFKDGMTAEQSSGLGWNASIVEFWVYLVPVGSYIQRHWSPELITFLELYRGFANYLGLKDMILDLDCTEPQPSPQALQYGIQSTQTPSYHPPQMTQIPSGSAPLQNEASAIYNLLPSYQLVFQQHLPQLPPSTTQAPPAPKVQTQFHNVMATGHNPTTVSSIAPQSPDAPDTPSHLPVQSQTPPQVDFKDINTWSGLNHTQLKQLSPDSFGFKTKLAAGQAFWKFTASVDFHETLTGIARGEETPDAVKSSLEKVALSFKRAAVVLRLQAKVGNYTRYSDTTQPTISDITALINRAAQLTDACGGLPKDASLKQWRSSCLFFHNSVYFEDKEVGDKLDRYYDEGVWPGLEKTWETYRLRWMID